MRSLASELRPIAVEVSGQPRVYADANLPAGAVEFMRATLNWDVLFVLEDPALRRAPDRDHYRHAREFARTLITCDRDFLDDKRFQPDASPGVIVCMAPDERSLCRLLQHVDRQIVREPGAADVPLRGRKIALTPDAAPSPST